MIHANVATSFSAGGVQPEINPTACIHPQAAVIGNVHIGAEVMVAPFASLRGDEGQPIHIGDYANVQDGVVVHGLETMQDGQLRSENTVTAEDRQWSVYIDTGVSLAHQCHVHGPAFIGAGTFVGMQALIFRARIGPGCILEPRCMVMCVHIPPGRYVPAGMIIRDAAAADTLPPVTPEHPLATLNNAVVHVNRSFASGYRAVGLDARP